MKQTYTSEQEALLIECRELVGTIEGAMAYFLERTHTLLLRLNNALSTVSETGEGSSSANNK